MRSRYPTQPCRFGKLLLLLPALRSVGPSTIEEVFFKKTIGNVPITRLLSDMYKSSDIWATERQRKENKMYLWPWHSHGRWNAVDDTRYPNVILHALVWRTKLYQCQDVIMQGNYKTNKRLNLYKLSLLLRKKNERLTSNFLIDLLWIYLSSFMEVT